jgi:hypothetical protein
MQMVLGAARFADERVRVAAYTCLCDISELYYEYLEPFMGDLFQLTGAAIKSGAGPGRMITSIIALQLPVESIIRLCPQQHNKNRVKYQ